MTVPPGRGLAPSGKRPPSATEAPRTVLISSRIDELGSSRRAAFRAVHDAGWIPLLYEVEPYEWLAAHISPSPGQSRILQDSHVQRLNERLSMDGLLEKADHFIGIYGTSLGDPSPQLCGLRPLEYELLRFLDTHVSRARGLAEPSLRLLFSVGSSPETCQRARFELRRALSQIRKKKSPYYPVFRKRVTLFLKRHAGDVPTSSQLYETIFNLSGKKPGRKKPTGPVRFFRSEPQQLPNGNTVYWRSSSRLYLEIRSRIDEWKGKPLPGVTRKSGNPTRWIKVRSLDRLGFALEVAEAVFYAGYNVRKVLMGTEKKASATRVIYLRVAPYLDKRPVKTLVADLRDKHRYDVSEYSRKTPAKPKRHRCSEDRWRLVVDVAARPGMLARVLTALALIDMRILNITITQARRNKRSSTGARDQVTLIFYRPLQGNSRKRSKARQKKDTSAVLPDSEHLARDFISAELTSIPGFYSVELSPEPNYGPRDNTPASSRRRTPP